MEKNLPVVALLAAYTKENRVIGNNGKIPWELKSERDRFKEICNGKKVIMGRKTFEEIGHALPYCTILIVSKTIRTAPEGCLLYSSLEEAVRSVNGEVLIAGGETIYTQALPLVTKVYATEILKEYEGNVFFPKLPGKWKKTILKKRKENNVDYNYVLYEKLV